MDSFWSGIVSMKPVFEVVMIWTIGVEGINVIVINLIGMGYWCIFLWCDDY